MNAAPQKPLDLNELTADIADARAREREKIRLQTAIQTVQLLTVLAQQSAKQIELLDEIGDLLEDDDDEEGVEPETPEPPEPKALPDYAKAQREDLAGAGIIERVVDEPADIPAPANDFLRAMSEPRDEWRPKWVPPEPEASSST